MTLKAPEGMIHAFHNDDEQIDEIRIITVPRYKTSELSGDEWRVSAAMQLCYKGKVLATKSVGNINSAVMMLGHFLIDEKETSTHVSLMVTELHDLTCDQSGCYREPISQYMMKASYDRLAHKDELAQTIDEHPFKMPHYRQFCQRHLKRGNCAFDDADSNYTVIVGPGPEEARPYVDDESPSGFSGVIDLTDLTGETPG